MILEDLLVVVIIGGLEGAGARDKDDVVEGIREVVLEEYGETSKRGIGRTRLRKFC